MARASFCWMLRRMALPVASTRMTAGSMPVTPIPETSAGAMPGGVDELARDLADIPPPLVRVFLGPVGMVRMEGRAAASPSPACRPRSSIRMPIVEVVPMSRPRKTGMPQRSPATRSMKRLTRSPSTAFQVSPSTLKWVPTMAPSPTARISATLSMLTPVLAKTGVSGIASLASLEVGQLHRLAGHRPGDQDDIGERGEDRALRPLRQRARADRRGELGVDVVHHLHVGRGARWRAAAARRRHPAAHSPMSES